MIDSVRAAYGSWKSPITSDLIVSDTIRLSQVILDGDDIYWIESRPSEAGRNVIVRRTPNGKIQEVTPKNFNVRTRVHEYGGGAANIKNGRIYFSHDKDQRLYQQSLNTNPVAITPEKPYRFADYIVDERHHQAICILEDHSSPANEVTNNLAAINLNHGSIRLLASGNDFYSSPCLSPDGQRLAWLTWNHPNMPWDCTELWSGEINASGQVIKKRKLAGGDDESIFQPQFSPDGALYFISDKNGWWNIYRISDGAVEPVLEREAEFGLPQWIFGMSTYAFASANTLVCTFFENGQSNLGILNTTTLDFHEIAVPFTYIEQVRAVNGKVVFIAGSPVSADAVVQFDLTTNSFEIVRRSIPMNIGAIESTYFSRPEPVEFPTENGMNAFAYFYPPQNRDYVGFENERPPLIVRSHGGPTASTDTSLDFRIQFWTSRGFAVIDVNYGGSTGYGRKYRGRLDGNWGLVDVADCVNAAKFLIKKALVDENRIAIAGGSAAGYTTLCALTVYDLFKAGASYYGISDLEAMAKDTHKFESRYLDRLIGPYPARKDLYWERSPIHFTEKLSCPVILMQGLEDAVVPPAQAEIMFEALLAKGLPVAYIPFEGEQHGFRKAETIKRALEAELYFYAKIFNFEPADRIEPVQIHNLK